MRSVISLPTLERYSKTSDLPLQISPKLIPNITVAVLFVVIAGALIAAGGTVVLGAGGLGVVRDF
jgi:preprotein translocase subunit Sec61beta